MKILTIILACCALASGARAESGDDGDLKSLLQEADSALQDRPLPKAKAKAKTRAESAPARRPEPIDPFGPAAGAATPPSAPIVPIDNADLKSILSVDLAAKERERSNHFPKSVVRLSAGLDWLANGYRLEKDDDTFEKIGGGQLSGAYLQYSPAWPLPFWNTPSTSLSFTLAMGVGFFQGNGTMRRTGVQTGDLVYELSLFPVDLDAGVVLSLWRKVGLQMTYGIGAEFLHQGGRGETDTTTQLFWADTAQIALRGYFTDTLEGYLGVRQRGLVVQNDRSARGNLVVAGIGFQFAD